VMQILHASDGSVRMAVFELAGEFVLVAAHKVPGAFEDEPGGDEEYLEADDLGDDEGLYDPDTDGPNE
jgi:hypothetical protein